MTLSFTVVNPGLLYVGSALASLPIIIHLLNRLRFRRVVWAAMEFLLAAHRKNARRIRIEQIILLLIRIAIIVLLAFAVGRPIFEGLLGSLGRSSVHRILVIDDSFSMGAQYGVSVGGDTPMKEAVKTALWIMKESDSRDGVSVILAGSNPHPRIGPPAVDHNQVVAEIEKLTVSDSATDMVGALEDARKILNESKFERKIVYVLTDNTEAGWRDEGGKNLRGLAAAISEQADLILVNLSRGPQANLAIRELVPEKSVVTQGILSYFRVEVANLSNRTVDRVVVNMEVDGRPAAPLVLGAIGSDKSGARQWSYTFEEPGDHTIVASVRDTAGDAVAVDSRRCLAVNVKEALDVLVVDGEPRSGPNAGETEWLELALDPRTRDERRETIFLVHWIRDSELDRSQTQGMDVVTLANVGSLSPAQAQVLKEFVQDGGSLLVFLGDQVRADDYNRMLYEDGKGLLPAFLAGVLGSTETGHEQQYTTFDARHFEHAALQAFKQVGGTAGFDLVPIYKYYQLKLPVEEGQVSEVILYLKDGNPGIVEKAYGRGKTILVATSADVEWSNFPRTPLYLELMHELMDYMTPDVLWRYNRLVDAGTTIPVSAAQSREAITMTRPDRKTEEVKPAAVDGRFTLDLSAEQLADCGLYTLEGPTFPRRRVAVNVDTAESDLKHLGEPEVRERLGHPTMAYAEGQSGLSDVLKMQQTAGGWARNMLYAMLALVLVETFLAWFFNRGT